MNKAQLIEALSTRFEGNKRAAAQALESVLDTITRQVAAGEKVGITGFGTFEKINRPSRMVRNPRTGERKRAKKTSVAKFRPGAELKAVVAGEKKLPKIVAAKKATAKVATTKAAASKSTAAAKTTATKAAPTKAAATTATTKKTTAKATTTKAAASKPTAAKKTTATKTTAKKTTARKAARNA